MCRNEKDELSPEVAALIDNGLTFLEKARHELNAGEDKYAIVSFWTAVEILLKVPLVHEHWTLVCTGKKITRQAYTTGDFQSVTYNETLERLGNILEKPLSKDTADTFDRVRRHRNRVVHFYHAGFSDAEHRSILAEQANAWFALNRLLREDWKTLFNGGLASRLARDETRLLAGNEYYAGVKMRHISAALTEFSRQGLNITRCIQCQQNAVVHRPLDTERRNVVFYTDCEVCSYDTDYIRIVCPGCSSKGQVMQGQPIFSCPKCDMKRAVFDLLDEWHDHHDEHLECSPYPVDCYFCGQSESVCQYGNGWLCSACFVFCDKLEECPHCSRVNNQPHELFGIKSCSYCSVDSEF